MGYTPCPPKCKYSGVVSHYRCCDYLEIVGKPRGCEGGQNCEKYERAVKKVRRYASHLRSYPSRLTFDAESARKLIELGLSDKAVAEELGTKKAYIARWRERNDIAENIDEHERDPRIVFDRGEARRLYDDGLSDREIAEKLGVVQQTINKWRLREGLPSNFRAPHSLEREEKQNGNG